MIDTTTRHLIDMLAMRIFEIQDARQHLSSVEEGLKARIRELEIETIKPARIINVTEPTQAIDEAW